MPEYKDAMYVINKDTGTWDFGFLYKEYLTLCRCIDGQYYQFYQRNIKYEDSYYTYIVDSDNHLILEEDDRVSYRYYTKDGLIYVWYYNEEKEVEWFTMPYYGLDMIFENSYTTQNKVRNKTQKSEFSISDFYNKLNATVKGIGSAELNIKPLIFNENGKLNKIYREEINKDSSFGSGFAASGSQIISGTGLAAYLEELPEDFYDEEVIEKSISDKKEYARITSINKKSVNLKDGRVYFDITVDAELLIGINELKSCRLWAAEDDATNPKYTYEYFHIENDIEYWPDKTYSFELKISVDLEDFTLYNGTLRLIPELHLQLNLYKTDDYTLYKTAPILLNLQYDYQEGIK